MTITSKRASNASAPVFINEPVYPVPSSYILSIIKTFVAFVTLRKNVTMQDEQDAGKLIGDRQNSRHHRRRGRPEKPAGKFARVHRILVSPPTTAFNSNF